MVGNLRPSRYRPRPRERDSIQLACTPKVTLVLEMHHHGSLIMSVAVQPERYDVILRTDDDVIMMYR